MQLKIQRSQRTGGVISSTVFFVLDVRADYSRTEQDNISKYKLGKQVIYNSRASQKHLDNATSRNDGSMSGITKGLVSLAMAKMNLNISIDSLGNGQHIECKDLEELLEAEEAVMLACRNVKQFLDVAATFDGRTILIDYDKEEKVHQSSGMPDLSRHAPSLPAPPPAPPILIEAQPARPEPPPTPSAPVASPSDRPEPQPEAHSAPMRPSIADQPMRPSPMRQEASPDSDFLPFFDRLDDESKSKLLKGALAVLGVAILLYVLGHL